MLLIDYSEKDNVLFYKCEKCGNINLRTADNMPQIKQSDGDSCMLHEGELLSCYACDNIHSSEIPLRRESEKQPGYCLKFKSMQNHIMVKRWTSMCMIIGGRQVTKVHADYRYKFWGEV